MVTHGNKAIRLIWARWGPSIELLLSFLCLEVFNDKKHTEICKCRDWRVSAFGMALTECPLFILYFKDKSVYNLIVTFVKCGYVAQALTTDRDKEVRYFLRFILYIEEVKAISTNSTAYRTHYKRRNTWHKTFSLFNSHAFGIQQTEKHTQK